MSESTRPARAPGAGGGGGTAGLPPAAPPPGLSPAERRRELYETLLCAREDRGVGRLALRLREDLRVPRGLLLLCRGDAHQVRTAARVVAGRISRSVTVEGLDGVPPTVAVVVPAPAPAVWRHALGVAQNVAARHDCLAVAAPPVAGLRALRLGYHRAVGDAALAITLCDGPLVMPDALVVPRMLARLDAAEQRAMLAPIQPLLAQPVPHRTAHLRTVDTLRRCGGSQVRAAAALHLHVNSVRYRVDRIEELTRLRIDEPADRMALDLAVMLVMLRGEPLGTIGFHDIRYETGRGGVKEDPLYVPGLYAA